jgi:hypothetical protein
VQTGVADAGTAEMRARKPATTTARTMRMDKSP